MKKINNFSELVNVWDNTGITFIETTRSADKVIGGTDSLFELYSDTELVDKIEQGVLFYKLS